MHKEFWLERWKNQQTGFHQNEVNSYLIKHWLKAGKGELKRVFVPLCGKSRDLIWLRDQGYDVVGIEFSQLAVEDFFQEQGLSYELTVKGKLNSYANGNITIYQGDFFDLNNEILGPVSIVYDRASLVALPDDLRAEYCKHLSQLTSTADILLVSMEYDQQKMQGPPFSVTECEIQKHYSTYYQVETLDTVDLLSASPKFKERGLESINEKVYKISPLVLS